jgi:hypothetical protein
VAQEEQAAPTQGVQECNKVVFVIEFPWEQEGGDGLVVRLVAEYRDHTFYELYHAFTDVNGDLLMAPMHGYDYPLGREYAPASEVLESFRRQVCAAVATLNRLSDLAKASGFKDGAYEGVPTAEMALRDFVRRFYDLSARVADLEDRMG